MRSITDSRLYLVISEEYGAFRGAAEIADLAISGGVDVIQMREKDKTEKELIELGSELSRLSREKGVIFIVNDDPVLASKVDADGVHLGQEDIKRYPISETRRIIGYSRIIGVSTHSVAEFEIANALDVDYIAFGPIFPTKTKSYFIGTKDIKKILGIAKKCVFFIGGITLSNLDSLLEEGATRIALMRAITQADDIARAARAFKDRIERKG